MSPVSRGVTGAGGRELALVEELACVHDILVELVLAQVAVLDAAGVRHEARDDGRRHGLETPPARETGDVPCGLNNCTRRQRTRVLRRTCISNATSGFSVCKYLIIEMRYPHACAANAGGVGCTDVASTRRRVSPAERRAASSSGVDSGTTRRARSMSDVLTPLCLQVNDASKISSRSTIGGSAIIILSSSSRAASRDVTSLSCARTRSRDAPD